MNQILNNCNLNNKKEAFNMDNSQSNNYRNNFTLSIKYIKWYKVIFFTSLILLIIFLLLFFIRLYKNIKNEEFSKKLISSYSISTMYSNVNSNDYSSISTESTPFVIRNN